MKFSIKVILVMLLIITTAISADAYTLSGDISGGVFFGGITYVFALSIDFIGGIEYYIGIVLFGIGPYSIFDVPQGEYILAAFQDCDYSMMPSQGDYYGFYGGRLPTILEVTGNTSGLDIEIRPIPSMTIAGNIIYQGNNTGLTLLQAAVDTAFLDIQQYSIVMDSTGSGEYILFTDPGIYYIRGFMDLNLNFEFDDDEPVGYYGFPNSPMPVDVTGSNQNNIDFELYDELIVPVIEDLVISIDGQDIILSWADIPQAIVYSIYKSDLPYFDINTLTPIGSSSNPTYTDEGALSQGAGFYVVTFEY